MQREEFRKWVEAGFQYYEKSPWLFIRELAQNSRDAGATAIEINATRSAQEEEIIIFEDNGRGMSHQTAVDFLFRLYASSKTDEKYAAGMFGIGFWSILRFNPQQIIIESKTAKEAWGLRLDSRLQAQSISPQLSVAGTKITLIRRAEYQDGNEFNKAVEQEVSQYCAFLRRNDRDGSPLPVFYLGKQMAREMLLPGPISISFKDQEVEGAVGLAAQPQLTLYAKGLPVFKGTTLAELSHKFALTAQQPEIDQGLSPIFLLNGNRLQVNIHRKEIIDDQALRKVRQTAEKAWEKLIESYLEQAYPATLWQRLGWSFKKAARFFYQAPLRSFLIILLILIPLELFVLHQFFPGKKSETVGNSVIEADGQTYSGATVDAISPAPTWQIFYQPGESVYLKVFNADFYDRQKGFVPHPQRSFADAAQPTQASPLLFALQIKNCGPGKIFLPIPFGYALDAGSIVVNEQQSKDLQFSINGDARLTLAQGQSSVSYRCSPIEPEERLSLEQVARLTQLPAKLPIPPAIENLLKKTLAGDREKLPQAAKELTQSLLSYDDSADTAAAYRNLQKETDWLAGIDQIKKGDCDVLNGLTVFCLRYWKIPARLAIGLVGENGQSLPGPHAWTEYFQSGWQILDSSIPKIPTAKDLTSTQPSWGNRVETQKKDRNSTVAFENPGYLVAIGLFFGIGLILFLLYHKKAEYKQILIKNDRQEIIKNLAQIALKSILHPQAGHWHANLWHHPILPTLNGKNIALKKALRLAGQGQLFIASQKNPQVQAVMAAGFIVLPGADVAFDPLIKMIPHAVNLDVLASLHLQCPEKVSQQPLAQLLAKINQLVNELKKPSFICFLSSRLTDQDLSYFFISAHPCLKKLNLQPLIVLNSESPRSQYYTELFQKNPQLAIFRLFKRILLQLQLPVLLEKKTMKQVSFLLFRQMP